MLISSDEALRIIMIELHVQVFECLREKQPEFASKLVVVEGDSAALKLGISKEQWTILTEEVNVVFHMAATIKFDEPLKVATLTNVRGTREAIELARHCKNLKKFVHVSTAFCHATYNRIGKKVPEEFHEAPVPPDVMIGFAENVEEARLNDVTAPLIRDWPNTYTFTKAIAEDIVRKAGDDLPICIVRPAIVMCSYKEPESGWMDMSCVYGPPGLLLGISMGVLRVLFVDEDIRLPLVPVDLVNNAIIASAWDSSLKERGGKVPIYTVANEESAMSWKLLGTCLDSAEFRRLAPSKSIWYCYLIETKNRVFFKVLTWVLHYIPAYIVDVTITLLRIKLPKDVPSFVKIYDKIGKISGVYDYFLTNEFFFQDQNVKKMLSRMSERDRHIFPCDLRTVETRRFLKHLLMGLKKYFIKEDPLSENGVKRQFYFRIANYGVILLYLYTFKKIIWFLFSNFRLAKNVCRSTIAKMSRFGAC